MRTTTVLAENGVPIFVGLPWSIVATDDMNLDGRPDIISHNAASGETQIWFMAGQAIKSRATVVVADGGSNLVGAPWFIMPH